MLSFLLAFSGLLQPIKMQAEGQNAGSSLVSGQLTKGITPLEGITFSIHEKKENPLWFDSVTGANGMFSFQLQDGSYQLEGIWLDSEKKWYQLDQTFEVKDGKLLGAETLLINLPTDDDTPPNVTGTLVKVGQPLSGITFSIHTNSSPEEWYDETTDENGNFQFNLPDGEFILDGIWLPAEEKWYPLAKLFQVSNGALVGGELKIELVPKDPPSPNVFGKLTKDGQALPDITFSIHTTDEPQQWFDITTDHNGDFQISLYDGEYQLDGIWVQAEEKWYPLNHVFTVSGTLNLPIDLSEKSLFTVTGTLTKGTEIAQNITFSIHTTNENQEWYSATTDEQGTFSFQLPAGEYQLDGIWVPVEAKWYPLNHVFTVNASMEHNINFASLPNEGNVYGTVSKASTPVKNIPFSIHSTGTNVQWYDTATNDEGSFTVSLPDGNYQVDGIWIESEFIWYELNKTFSVENGSLVGGTKLLIELTVETATPNISGTVLKGSHRVSDVWVSTHSLEPEPQWYDTKTDTTGKFAYLLPDGDYQIDGIWIDLEQKWYPLELVFSVEDGKLVGHSSLTLQLIHHSSGNVQGIVSDENGPLGGVEVRFRHPDSSDLFVVRTDENGHYAIPLPDGAYTAESVTLIDSNETIYLDEKIEVIDNYLHIGGELADQLNLTLPGVTLKLQITQDGQPVTNLGVEVVKHLENNEARLYYTPANEEGIYPYRLVDGIYDVVGYYDEEDNYYPLRQTIQVLNGSTVPSPFVIEIADSQANVKGLLQDEDGPLAAVNIYFENIDEGTTLVATTDQNGQYQIQLPDGHYNAEGVYIPADEEFFYLDQTFQVIDGSPVMDGYPISQLNLLLPPYSLNVQLLKDDITQTNYTVHLIQYRDDGNRYFSTKANTEGIYSFRLKDGEYEIDGYEDENGNYHYINEFVQVLDGTTTPNPYTVDISNEETLTMVEGVIHDGQTPVGDANLIIYNPDTFTSYHSTTDEYGSFTADLPDGNYVIEEFFKPEIGNLILEESFTVQDQKVYVKEQEVPKLEFQLPSGSLHVKIFKDGEPLVGELTLATTIHDGTRWLYIETNESGEANLRTPNREYTIESITSKDGERFPIDQSVTVENGTTNPTPVVIHLGFQPNSNVYGKLKDENGVSLSDYAIMFEDLNSGEKTTAMANKTGDYEVQLADGEYKILLLWNTLRNQYYFIDRKFQIADGKLIIGGEHADRLDATIPPITLKVQLIDQETDAYITGYTVVVTQQLDNGTRLFVAHSDEDGNYSFRLAPGEYEITNYQEHPNVHSAIGAKIQILGGVTGPILFTHKISVEKPESYTTVNGVVRDDNGVIEGAKVKIFDKKANKRFNIQALEDGTFTTQLGNGEYEIEEVKSTTAGNFYRLGTFAVFDGKVFVNDVEVNQIPIQLPGETLHVQILKDGLPLIGKVRFYTISGESVGSWEVITNELGEFTHRAADGDYMIDGILVNNNYIKLNKIVTVDQGKTTQSPYIIHTRTVNGKLETNSSIFYPWVIIQEKGNTSEFQRYSVRTDENDEFQLVLPDGQYEVVKVGDNLEPLNQTQILTQHRFIVDQGVLFENGLPIEQLTVELPSASFKGMLQEEGQTIIKGFVFIENLSTHTTETYYTKYDDLIHARLADGRYRIYRGTYDTANMNSGLRDLDIVFEVFNGKMYFKGEETGLLDINFPKETLKVQLYDGDNYTEGGSIRFKTADGSREFFAYTDSNGYVTYRLFDGDFVLTDIMSGIKVYHPFSIIDGKLVEYGHVKSKLDIKIPGAYISGKLLDGDVPLANQTIIISNGSSEWAHQVTTDANGNYITRLEDGDYKVVQADLYRDGKFERIPLNIPFKIKDYYLHVNGQVTNSLDLKLPSESLKGQVLEYGKPSGKGFLVFYRTLHGYTSEIQVEVNENGQFSYRLTDGEYILDAFHKNSGISSLREIIEVKDGTTNPSPLVIDVHSPITHLGTVLGSVQTEGEPIEEADVEIINIDTQTTHRVKSNKEGNFVFHLPDGHYRAFNVHIPSRGDVEVDSEFNVSSGLLFVNGQSAHMLTIDVPTLAMGSWMWDASMIHDPDTLISEMKALKIHHAIINVGYDPGIKDHYLNNNKEQYDLFIKKSHDNSMTVEALYGNSEWTYEELYWHLEENVKYVLSFNETHENRFDAIHLDIEPHTLTDKWLGNEASLLTQYLNNLRKIKTLIDKHNQTSQDDIKLVVDMPYWIDTYKTLDDAPFLPQLFEIVDEVAVMDYTQNVEVYVDAGVKFLKIAQEKGKKVSIGSEFLSGTDELNSITLANKTKAELDAYFNEGIERFKNFLSFKQLNVHTFEAYKGFME
jgi:hypothetical protein